MQVAVSVIVPVIDDPDGLRDCLTALGAQTLSRPYEILVVDNGSTKPPRELVAAHRNARLLYEAQSGSYSARNTGISRAAGSILAFTDSDCVPERDWLERGVIALEREGPHAFIVGRVDVFPRERTSPTGVELWEMAHAFPQERYASKSFGATANLFVYRSAFEDIGVFDTGFSSGSDREWGQRAGRHGFRATYADDVRIRHPARRSFHELSRKMRRVYGSRAERSGIEHTRAGGLERFVLLIPSWRKLAYGWRSTYPATARFRARYLVAALRIHAMRTYERVRSRVRASLRGARR